MSKKKSPGYRGEKPIPYDRVVNKSIHHEVGIPGANCSHRLDHRGSQFPSIEEIWFLWFWYFEFVLFLLGPCVANVYHEQGRICHYQTNSCKTVYFVSVSGSEYIEYIEYINYILYL